MKAIKKRFLYCFSGAVLCAGAAVFYVSVSNRHVVVLFGAVAIILMVFTVKAWECYQSAKLISENPILSVGMASVSETDSGSAESAVNVVVSGFGILLDGKPYKFGRGGISLTDAAIDRESITLFFGGEEKSYSVRLLHGVAEKADIFVLRERIRYETGVLAAVSGW